MFIDVITQTNGLFLPPPPIHLFHNTNKKYARSFVKAEAKKFMKVERNNFFRL